MPNEHFTCTDPNCRKPFDNPAGFAFHMKKAHGDRRTYLYGHPLEETPSGFKCWLCAKTCMTAHGLSSHLANRHAGKVPGMQQRPTTRAARAKPIVRLDRRAPVENGHAKRSIDLDAVLELVRQKKEGVTAAFNLGANLMADTIISSIQELLHEK